jgi:hypothetical protein
MDLATKVMSVNCPATIFYRHTFNVKRVTSRRKKAATMRSSMAGEHGFWMCKIT